MMSMQQAAVRHFDLELNLAPDGTQLALRVLDSPTGSSAETVTAPNPLHDAAVAKLLAAARQPRVSNADLRDLGLRLSASLIPPPIGDRLRTSLRDFADVESPLRLRIVLGPASAHLATAPWELTYDEEQGGFLAVDPRVHITRLVPTAGPPQWLRPAAELGILVGHSGLAPIDREALATFEQLSANLAGLPATRAQLLKGPATIAGLIERLRDERLNVLHLHAGSRYVQDQPLILMAGEQGESMGITPAALGSVLRGSSVPLAVLGPIGRPDEPGSPEETHALLDFAARLVAAGVPAVLVVPITLGERSAGPFWREFYNHLLIGDPLDAAVRAGRETLWQRRGPAPTWYLPALFTASGDQALWPFGPGGPGAAYAKGSTKQRPA
jgi:hypothetical protein